MPLTPTGALPGFARPYQHAPARRLLGLDLADGGPLVALEVQALGRRVLQRWHAMMQS
jgi:hypothetical protein